MCRNKFKPSNKLKRAVPASVMVNITGLARNCLNTHHSAVLKMFEVANDAAKVNGEKPPYSSEDYALVAGAAFDNYEYFSGLLEATAKVSLKEWGMLEHYVEVAVSRKRDLRKVHYTGVDSNE